MRLIAFRSFAGRSIFPEDGTPTSSSAGEVGYVIAGIKSLTDTKIGDTIIDPENPVSEPCPGYKDIKPMVFCGFYPTASHQYENLRDALNKLRLNDASFQL